MRAPGDRWWITAAVLLGLAASGAAAQEPVDLLLHNGRVFTADEMKSIHRAVAIRGNRIVAVGGNALLDRYSALRTIDLRGRLVTPGFIDTHIHVFGTARRHIDFAGTASIQEFMEKVRDKADELGPGEWITGYGWSEDEFGVETWGDEWWRESGDLGSWCCLSADEELGYVYVPLSAPTAAYYGGHRPGDNLFSNSLVALDAATGERIWHFQMVRHDIWEYDTVGPATLGELVIDGRRIRSVMQPSKTGFLYTFDRVTGEPV